MDYIIDFLSSSYFKDLFKWVLVTVIGAWLIPKNLFKYKTIFVKLHEKRADVINNLYSSIVDMEREFSLLINPVQFGQHDVHEKTKAAINSINNFKDNYRKSAIYFDVETNEILSNVDNLMHESIANFQSKDWFKNDVKKEMELWNSAWNSVKDDLPRVKNILARKFSTLLGVKPSVLYQIRMIKSKVVKKNKSNIKEKICS